MIRRRRRRKKKEKETMRRRRDGRNITDTEQNTTLGEVGHYLIKERIFLSSKLSFMPAQHVRSKAIHYRKNICLLQKVE